MATVEGKSLQTGLKNYVEGTSTKDITQYSYFLGGLNAKSAALSQYDAYKGGYARIFFTKMPTFMKDMFEYRSKQFKHIMEYGFIGIDGIQNLSLEFEQINAKKTLDVATSSKDETSSITIKTYEQSGSLIRDFMTMWITGISDESTDYCHYHGALDGGFGYTLPNASLHTAEAIYVVTGSTGRANDIEYACLLSNMMPKSAKQDHLNYEMGSHTLAQVDCEFTAVKYVNPDVNARAKELMEKYTVLRNFMNMTSGYSTDDIKNLAGSNIKDWK